MRTRSEYCGTLGRLSDSPFSSNLIGLWSGRLRRLSLFCLTPAVFIVKPTTVVVVVLPLSLYRILRIPHNSSPPISYLVLRSASNSYTQSVRKAESKRQKRKEKKRVDAFVVIYTNQQKKTSRGKPATEGHEKIIDIERKIQNLQISVMKCVTNV
jgi:hypothetical protein